MTQTWGGDQRWGGTQTWGAATGTTGTTGGVFTRVNLPIPGGQRSPATAPATAATSITRNDGKLVATRLALSRYLFDPDAIQGWTWSLRIPDEYVGGGDVRIYWGSTSTTGDVTWRTGVSNSAPATTDTTLTVPAPDVEGLYRETIISLQSTNFTAGSTYTLYLARSASAATDTCDGTADVVAVAFEYLIELGDIIVTPPGDGGTGLYGSGTYGSGNYGA